MGVVNYRSVYRSYCKSKSEKAYRVGAAPTRTLLIARASQREFSTAQKFHLQLGFDSLSEGESSTRKERS